MSNPYLGEIRIFAGSFAPVGWAFCDGSIQQISQNTALFNLIGTTYGGDGQTTFALPDLRGRAPVHQGTGTGLSAYVIGQAGGVEAVTLTQNEMPAHAHTAQASSTAGASQAPAGNVWAAVNETPYGAPGSPVAMDAGALSSTGGSQPHDNMVPFLTLAFIIATSGVFPSP